MKLVLSSVTLHILIVVSIHENEVSDVELIISQTSLLLISEISTILFSNEVPSLNSIWNTDPTSEGLPEVNLTDLTTVGNTFSNSNDLILSHSLSTDTLMQALSTWNVDATVLSPLLCWYIL
jgi:hypothetical protein